MSQSADDRVCRVCNIFVPEGRVFYRYQDGTGLCIDCEKKSAIPQEFPDWPHAGIAYFVALLVVIAGSCVFGAILQAEKSDGNPVLYLLAAVLWLALAVGLHLLRRILITVEESSAKPPRVP